MSLFRLVLLVSLMNAGLAAAQAAAPASKILGLSDMTCAAWAKTKSDPELRQPYLDWARGFLSGHNYGQPGKPVSVVSNGTVSVYIDRHCAEKSSSTVDAALMRMSDEYSGRNAPITR